MPRRAAFPVLVAAACVVVIAVLVVGAALRGDRDSVDDLPSVAEVAAAQAHGHGLRPDDLTDEERAALLAPPTAATDATALEQLTEQIGAVARADGAAAALELLALAALADPAAAAECPRVYQELIESLPTVPAGLPPADVVCPAT